MKIYVYCNLNSVVLHKWRYIKDYSSFILNNQDNLIYFDENFNFDYKNYVNSEIIINIDFTKLKYFQNITYVIVEDENYYTSWYVLATSQIRGCQFKLILKRDLLNDFFTYIKNYKYNINRCFYKNLNYNEIDNFIFSHLKNEDSNLINNSNELLYSSDSLIYDYYFTDEVTWELSNLSMFSQMHYFYNDNDEYGKCLINPKAGFYLIFLTENTVDKTFEEMDINGFTIYSDKWNGGGIEDKNELLSTKISFNRQYCEPYYIVIIPKEVTRYIDNTQYNTYALVSKIKEKFGDNILDIQFTSYLDFKNQVFLNSYFLDNLLFRNYFAEKKEDKIAGVFPLFTLKNNNFSNTLYFQSKFIWDLNQLKIFQTKYNCYLNNYTQNNSYKFSFIDLANADGNINFVLDQYSKPYSSVITFSVVNAKIMNTYNYDFKKYFFVDSGNKSLSLNTDIFAQYELDNKNYQNIFNRQLQTNDVNMTLNSVATGLSGAGQFATGLATANAKAITGGFSQLATLPFSIGTYFNNRNSQIDIQNMQIENIKNLSDKPIINNLFSSNFYQYYNISIYKDFDENIEEYELYLKNYGILWNANSIMLNTFLDKIKVDNFEDIYSLPYLKCEICFTNDNNFNILNNLLYNEINSELSSGVFLEKEVFDGIKGV